MEDYIDISGTRINVRIEELPVLELRFYEENPRVYTILRTNGGTPSQEEIEEHMLSMEHVKVLRQSIKKVGLIDPLIVRDGDFVVLEGNSRLAAYRKLVKEDPVKWGKVKCKILPRDIEQSTILTILGQYHIVGRKDWSPFEQAGFLVRGLEATKVKIEDFARSLGLSTTNAKKYIEVYGYMKEQNDLNPMRWSYYEEFLKNRAIKNVVKDNPELEEKVVEDIKTGKIHEASDIRKLGDIVKSKSKAGKKALAQYREGKVSLEKAYESVKESGVLDEDLQRIRRFKEFINDPDLEDKFDDINDDLKNKINFEINAIMKRLKAIQSKLK
ncbi:MAG: ParB N-terminal domain-containing protein [Bacteroidales bacterium]|nr:ParB N-terminal domain-containing protein [Bacteroidales bacterium]